MSETTEPDLPSLANSIAVASLPSQPKLTRHYRSTTSLTAHYLLTPSPSYFQPQ